MRTLRLLLLLSLPAATLNAQTADPRAARMDSIFHAIDRTASPGCAAGALQNGRFLHARGYGMADLERGTVITGQTVFYTGSVSKQFTAMSLALLARDGRLSLDDPARKYLPEIGEMGRGITLRHMVHHTSGLREKWELLSLAGHRDGDLVTQQDVLDLVKNQRALNFPPGDDHLYNNTAYDLLATVVARVSGKSIREFAAERIFGPLGMDRSRYVDDRAVLIPGRASGYSISGGRISLLNPIVETVGSGSVYSTLEDLARWDESFYTGALGGDALLQLVQTPGTLTDGTRLTYAFGLMVDEWRGLRRVQHGGALAGFRTQITRFPDQHFSAIVLCNFAQANPAGYADRIAEVWLGDRLAALTTPAATGESRAFDSTLAARAAGIYRSTRTGSVVRLERDAEGLLYLSGPVRARLTAGAANRAMLRAVAGGTTLQGELIFEVGSNGAINRFRRTAESPLPRPEIFQRVPPAVATPSAMKDLAGAYRNAELDVTWTMAVQDSGLVVTMARGRTARLTPVYRDGFTLEGSNLLFERDRRGRVTALLLTPGRSRFIRFDRVR